MQRTKKRKKAALVLPVLLAGSGVVMACVGFVLKAKWKDTGRYEGRMALAVPFLVMQDQESPGANPASETGPSVRKPPQRSHHTAVSAQTEHTEPSEEAERSRLPCRRFTGREESLV
ncbi:MAG: hypothetical protein ACLU9S_10690 [Oscillospiraceae bacterium]